MKRTAMSCGALLQPMVANDMTPKKKTLMAKMRPVGKRWHSHVCGNTMIIEPKKTGCQRSRDCEVATH